MSETMADFSTALDNSMRQLHEGDLVDGTVVGISDTEVTVDLQYFAEGIIRADEWTGDPSFSIKEGVTIGDAVKAQVIRMDDGNGNILLSRKKALDAIIWDQLSEMKKEKTHVRLKITQAVKGGVVGFYEGIRAFIPASKVSLGFTEDLESFVGQEVEAIIVTAEKEGKKLVLSVRDVLREAAEAEKARMVSNLEVGLVTEGKVQTLTDYGAFVSIGNGIDGLVHVSQITNERRIKHPKEVLSVGDTVKVKITRIQDGKISLSMKALEEAVPQEVREEKVKLPKSEDLTTSLASLLGNIKLD